MPSATAIAKRIWDIFSRPTPPLRKTFLNHPQVPPLPGLAAGAAPIKDFSAFLPAHADRVNLVKEEMDRLVAAIQSEDTGLTNALDFFESLFNKENPDLLFYSLRFFLVHYKGVIKFMIPALTVSDPEIISPSAATGHGLPFAVGSPEETKLDWFRESPSINEHHEHWHIVYFAPNIDRQGEMFLYMHQQMIARYDVERMAENVAAVSAFDDFSKPIAIGYAPGPDERLSGFINSGRMPNIKVNSNDAQKQINKRAAIIADIDGAVYDPTNNSLAAETKAFNRLGATIEPSRNPDADRGKSYYGYHGDGHIFIADINNGVMRTTVTAVRDVVFWEWHKGIDDFYSRLQERFEPYNFALDPPPVLLRKSIDNNGQPYSPDIILVSGNNIPGANAGTLVFGGNNWNNDFGKGNFNYTENGVNKTVATSDTLNTSFKQGMIRYNSPSTGMLVQVPYTYLIHDPIGYFIRIENTSALQKQVTVRIFIVPEAEAENRRLWIEMDKFLQELAPHSKTVIFRKDTESSVIRKPHVADPANHFINFDPTDIQQDDLACDCGWPYQMLLPKGKKTGDGMAFKIMVMVSDAAIDMTENENDCGSLSFCAARSNEYPDKRPLGYPFNRPFTAANNIMNTIRSQDNMACRSIFIKHQ